MASVLLIGLGRFGRHMAAKFEEEGSSVLAIEKDQERADNAVSIISSIQIADATNEEFIERLGVDNFDICVVAIGDNFQSALETTVLLKDYGAKFILARANNDIHKKLLLRNGADDVIYAEREMAERMAIKYSSKNILDYVEISPDIAVYEIATPESWCGKSIIEKSVRTKYDVSILAIKKDGRTKYLPSPDHVFSKGETLMVVGRPDSIKNFTRER